MILLMLKAYHYAHMSFPIPVGHRYALPRYVELYEESIASGLFAVYKGPRATDEQLLLVHTANYLHKLSTETLSREEVRLLGLPFSTHVVERARAIVGATVEASYSALADGCAFVLGGGTHHAHPEFASGFCVFNDIAIATKQLAQERRLSKVVVVDCDVHQGDGTAVCLQPYPHFFTFSVHGAGNFPFEKAQSNLDIPLQSGTGDGEYLRAVKRGLKYALTTNPPDLVYYIAGADPHEADRLGRLSITDDGLARRDNHVLLTCQRRGIPVVVLMGGGYGKQLAKTIDLNMQTIYRANEIFGNQTAQDVNKKTKCNSYMY